MCRTTGARSFSSFTASELCLKRPVFLLACASGAKDAAASATSRERRDEGSGERADAGGGGGHWGSSCGFDWLRDHHRLGAALRIATLRTDSTNPGGWVDSAAVALKRLVLLAAGAGAVWYARQKLSEDGSPSSRRARPGRPSRPPARRSGFPTRPRLRPSPSPRSRRSRPRPSRSLRSSPARRPTWSPAPAAFEDAHQEGWQDEQLGEDPKNLDELEIDPATAQDADLDAALEEDEELAEDVHDPTIAHPRTEPAHVTRVVDDLLEGRRGEPDEEPIEDATLVEEERDQRSS